MAQGSGRIVVGVDGSGASVDAIKWAVAQAALTGASVEAIICWSVPVSFGVAMGAVETVDWESNSHEILDAALSEAIGDSGAVVTKKNVQGHPADVLVEASKGAELVVVGSRGHGGFVGAVLGSVSSHVVAHARCPVVVTRERDES
ncbi:nucleotide-binding universal stress UspA family protein [Antricoccus suffuscus]|uniref:Nucleotide-binding universal stress UspA family protein n=1 Tax=Antricoccus suffuscus TaxID=1629062 RepID=A0A2T0ZB94_9ACTN|nr:universal stress protein [Antricoccus suffuscus]PRZ33571.1 nucleotide-binding universal stress UspA family protein [Antricoccus suffuscus]